MYNQNQVQQQNNVMTVLNERGQEIKAVLPAHIKPEKFFQICQTAAMLNPDLQVATPSSLFTAFLQCAKDGLIPDNKEAAIVLYNKKQGNNWVKEAEYQPMVDGVMKRLRQSGEVLAIDAKVVYLDDRFEHYTDLEGDHLLHVPNYQSQNRTDSNIMLFFARAKTKTGEVMVEVMTKAEVDQIMMMSKSAVDKNGHIKPYSVWAKFYVRMGLKTVLHRIAKRLPNSSEIMEMIERDIDMKKMENGVFVEDKTASPEAEEVTTIALEQQEELKQMANSVQANLQQMFGFASSRTGRVVKDFAELDQQQYQLLHNSLEKKLQKQAQSHTQAQMQAQGNPVIEGQMA